MNPENASLIPAVIISMLLGLASFLLIDVFVYDIFSDNDAILIDLLFIALLYKPLGWLGPRVAILVGFRTDPPPKPKKPWKDPWRSYGD